jgi:hypothetical protein
MYWEHLCASFCSARTQELPTYYKSVRALQELALKQKMLFTLRRDAPNALTKTPIRNFILHSLMKLTNSPSMETEFSEIIGSF